MDDGVSIFEFGGPWTGSGSVPVHGAPWGGLWVAGEDEDVVALCVEMTGEDGADLAAAAWEEDLQWRPPLIRGWPPTRSRARS